MSLGIACLCVVTSSAAGGEPSAVDIMEFRVPAPPAVGSRKVEVGFEMAMGGSPSFIKSSDGRIMLLGAGPVRYSRDKGKTWSKPEGKSPGVGSVIRLNSGKLGGFGGSAFAISEDEGKTWTKQGHWAPKDAVKGHPMPNTMIQTGSGRIIRPLYWALYAHKGHYEAAGSWGTLNGELIPVEGHAHYPEPAACFVIYSDDQGKSWHRNEGSVIAWLDHGYGGYFPTFEPDIIEASNGDVVMFMRTTLGRFYTARSRTLDYLDRKGKRIQRQPGQRFDLAQPTDLATSESPCAMERIPETGHWLIVWNQVSGDETRASHRRGRLSSAISEDDGITWKHFRTIDNVVLPPAGRVELDPAPRLARGLDYVGVLPQDYGGVTYPTVSVADDTVFVVYSRMVVNRRPGDAVGKRLRVLPLSWFYQDEPPPLPSPALFLRVPVASAPGKWNVFPIPARYHDGRFFCHLKDLQSHLKSPAGRLGFNMYAPLHQVITALGWTPRYDRSKLDDADNPSMTVTCTHGIGGPAAEKPPTSEIPGDKPVSLAPGEIKLAPAQGIPVKLYAVPLGTSKSVVFNLPFDPATIAKVWLDMAVSDIDDPKEATITLNAKTAIKVEGTIIADDEPHYGRLVVPPGALAKGANTFEFAFVDNLNGSTQGYDILGATLVFVVK